MPPRIISDTFKRSKTDTSLLNSPNTPNTRKRQRNYTKLHKHGLDESPTISSIQTPRRQKKPRLNPPTILLQPLRHSPHITLSQRIIIDDGHDFSPSPTP